MSEIKQQILAEILESQLAQTEQWWVEGKEHAFIIGYLQGMIKQVLMEIKD